MSKASEGLASCKDPESTDSFEARFASLEKALTALPGWMDTLRAKTSQTLLADLVEAVQTTFTLLAKAVADDEDADKNEPKGEQEQNSDGTVVLEQFQRFSKCVSNAATILGGREPTFITMRDKVTEAVSLLHVSRKQKRMQTCIHPFVTHGGLNVKRADGEALVKCMEDSEMDSLKLSSDLENGLETCFLEATLYLAHWLSSTSGGEHATFCASLSRATSKMHRLLGQAGSEEKRKALHEALGPAMQLREFILKVSDKDVSDSVVLSEAIKEFCSKAEARPEVLHALSSAQREKEKLKELMEAGFEDSGPNFLCCQKRLSD